MRRDTDNLRVLFVDYSIGFGGAIKSLSLTLRRLQGVDVHVLTSQDPGLIESWLGGYPVERFRTVVNYRLLSRVRRGISAARVPGFVQKLALRGVAAADWGVSRWNTRRIAAYMRRHRIDLVHLNNGFGPDEVLDAARKTGARCLVHLRYNFTDRSPGTVRRMGDVDHVIAVSDHVARGLEGTPVPADRITTIHDPVDLDLVSAAQVERERVRMRHGIADGEIAIGIFGRVIRWKGQQIFAEAAIRAMREEPRIRPVIVGDESDGSHHYFDGVRETIRQAGVADRFVMTGYTEEVEAHYAAMDIVVHASTTPEPFGMVVPEAMAARCAVIAADEGGPREVITHGEDGLRVPPRDVGALAEAMLRLARDVKERERLANRAVETAHVRFGIEANAAAVRAVYDRLPGRADEAAAPRPEVVVGVG